VRRYGRILVAPRVGPTLAAVVLARLPLGILSVAVLLYIDHVSGSYATAGVVAGAATLGLATGTVLGTRLIDYAGLRVLVAVALAHAVALLTLVALGQAGAGIGALMLGGLATGLTTPPLSSTLRSLWPRLLADEPELVPTAFSLDSVVNELVFLSGPALAGVLYAVVGPASPLLVSSAIAVVGTCGFVWLTRHIHHTPEHAGAERSWRGPLVSRGVRALTITALPTGIGFGCLEVSLVGAGEQAGRPELAGVLIGMLALGSAVGGLLYGLAPPPRARLPVAHLATLLAMPLAIAPLIVAPELVAVALLALLAGAPIAPYFATRDQLATLLAPLGTRTEALGWPLTMLIAGNALGTAIGGLAVDHVSLATGFGLATGGVAAAAAVAAATRATLGRELTVVVR
jgi:predicted MFS family arabinose efflux permease